jgi:putative flippase GtrA
VLALICGICVSYLTNRLFEHLINKWKNNSWDKYVLATLIDLSVYYVNSLSCNYAPCFVGHPCENYSNDKNGIVKVFGFGHSIYTKNSIGGNCLS